MTWMTSSAPPRLAELKDQQLGSRGVTDAVNQVAQTERSVGIEDLAGFTPQLP
jgi:hypothetical protein